MALAGYKNWISHSQLSKYCNLWLPYGQLRHWLWLPTVFEKVFFCVPLGRTWHRTVRPRLSQCTPECICIIKGWKSMHTSGAQCLKSCARWRNCACRASSASLISITGPVGFSGCPGLLKCWISLSFPFKDAHKLPVTVFMPEQKLHLAIRLIIMSWTPCCCCPAWHIMTCLCTQVCAKASLNKKFVSCTSGWPKLWPFGRARLQNLFYPLFWG